MTSTRPDDYTGSSPISSQQARAAIVDRLLALPHELWQGTIYQPCDFGSKLFTDACLELVENPSGAIGNQSPPLHSDILYDSHHRHLTEGKTFSKKEEQRASDRLSSLNGDSPGYKIRRVFLRRLSPRDVHLETPIIQSVIFLFSDANPKDQTQRNGHRNLVMFIPHVSNVKDIPTYIPQVQAYAYCHFCPSPPPSDAQSPEQRGRISFHEIYPPLGRNARLVQWSHDLLADVKQRCQSSLINDDTHRASNTLPSERRVQDQYMELEERHAPRILDTWAEPAEPSKRLYEDLSIAAFLIELWKQMYQLPARNGQNGAGHDASFQHKRADANSARKPPFRGFVDIGCGTGVLVDVLIREGFHGWGFDAHERKTWKMLSLSTRKNLKQLVLIPATICASAASSGLRENEIFSRPTTQVGTSKASKFYCFTSYFKRPASNYHGGKENNDPVITPSSRLPNRHDGIFPTGTFIISNHADELSPWTPLLASLSSSPFLCIPCCAHNLSGQRFRTPSASNGYKANSAAPKYFAPQVSKAKHVPIGGNSPIADSENKHHGGAGHPDHYLKGAKNGIEQGDLQSLRHARHTEKSSYSSLCDWIVHLAEECGFAVEKHVLDSSSQRNLAIVGRPWRQGFASKTLAERQDIVKAIVKRENVNPEAWMQRCNILVEGNEGLSVH